MKTLAARAVAPLMRATAWGHVGVVFIYLQVLDSASLVMDGKDDWSWSAEGVKLEWH